MAKAKVVYTFNGKTEEVSGRQAQTLLALVDNKKSGVTALEMSSWALRLAAYVHQLKALGLEIDCIREPHSGGSHGRYFLRSDIQITSRSVV